LSAGPGTGTGALVAFPAAIAVDAASHTTVRYDGIETVFESIR
jgi:hypothetical protein